ncbi:MAG TPA: flippase, partial [Candidatus Limnocylindrales bacterium]|nr:flippase [Candidatus Limnocylindrales bacterium]
MAQNAKAGVGPALLDRPEPAAALSTSPAADAPQAQHVLLAAKGTGVVFAGKLFAWGSRLVLAVVLARTLGAEGYGLYNLGLVVPTIAASFVVLGLDAALVRYVSVFRRRDDAPRVWGAILVGVGLPGLLGLGAAGVIFLAADLIAERLLSAPQAAPLLRISCLLVPAMALNRELGATLQGLKRIELAVLAEQFVQPITRFALVLGALLVVGLDAATALVASTLGTLTATGLLTRSVHRLFSLRRSLRAAQPEVRTFLAFSLPVYFSNVVGTLGSNLQAILLSALDTLRSVGIFAVASSVNLLASLFHGAVVQAAMPIFAEIHDRGDRRGLEHLYQTTSKWTFSLNLPLFIAVALTPDAILSIFGRDFAAGAAALVILTFESLVNSGTGTSGAVLDMTGHTRVKFVNSTLSVGLSIGLSLLLIPVWGLIGAALAALGSTAIVNLLRVLEVWLLLGVTPYSLAWLKPISAGAVAATVGALAL